MKFMLYLLFHFAQTGIRVIQIKVAYPCVRIKIVHGKTMVVMITIEPEIPQKQRIGNFRVLRQEFIEIKNHPVVQRGLHTDFM